MSENNLISEPGSLSRVRNINQSTELRVLYNDNIGPGPALKGDGKEYISTRMA